VGKSFLVATFSDADSLLRAVPPLREACFRIYDVHAPFPIHGLDEAMQVRRTRLPLVTLAAGLTGLALAIALQGYTNLVDWPLNVGGKPTNSALAFVPISFELTVLLGGLGTVAAFLLRARLFPGKQPRLPAARVTDDRFALVLRRPEDEPAARRAWRLLEELGAQEIEERRP
jgi:Protein of unknown function (DUF3341)